MRLATFNVLHGRSLTDGQVDATRLRAAVAGLDADVLAIQEVDRAQPRSHGLDLTAEVGAAVGARTVAFAPALLGTPGERWTPAPPGSVISAGRPGAGLDGPSYGVGLVSRREATALRVLVLPKAPVRSPVLVPGMGRTVIWLADEPRVALAATLPEPASPTGSVTVVSTHLSFVPGWNLLQLQLITRWLRATASGPAVLLGDLNMPGPCGRTALGWRPLATGATFPAPKPRLRLDHILGRAVPAVAPGAGPRTMALSDHRALVADVPAWAG